MVDVPYSVGEGLLLGLLHFVTELSQVIDVFIEVFLIELLCVRIFLQDGFLC